MKKEVGRVAAKKLEKSTSFPCQNIHQIQNKFTYSSVFLLVDDWKDYNFISDYGATVN